MAGTTYTNALNFSGNVSNRNQHTLHNLHQNFTTLDGYFGYVSGAQLDVTFNIIGDGRLIQSFDASATAAPMHFSVSVAGVDQLRIEVVFPTMGGAQSSHWALAAYIQ